MMELIQKLIHDAAVEQLRKKRKVSPHEAPSLSDEEMDHILFNGNMDGQTSRPFGMRESFDDTAKIGTSDITQFEQQMNDMMANVPNAVLTFDQQKNGQIIMLKNEGAISVVSSGKIAFGTEGEVTWMFSIPNGFRIQTEGLEVTQSNKDTITNLANYYDTWQRDWRQKLLAPDGGKGQEQDGGDQGSMNTPPAGAPTMDANGAMGQGQSSEAPQGGGAPPMA